MECKYMYIKEKIRVDKMRSYLLALKADKCNTSKYLLAIFSHIASLLCHTAVTSIIKTCNSLQKRNCIYDTERIKK